MLGLARTLGYTGSDGEAGLAFTITALTHLGGGDPVPLIRTILTYAVVSCGTLNDTALVFAGPLVPLQGGRLRVLSDRTVLDFAPSVADAQIVEANLGGANGFIHIVDRVLLPLPLCPAVLRGECAARGGHLDEEARRVHSYQSFLPSRSSPPGGRRPAAAIHWRRPSPAFASGKRGHPVGATAAGQQPLQI
ncbi:hypothetical protein I4F81_001475 [Pyropia yezoensis]|uniref:Uncharacterized protein n=1 Tax=Pyropia yezoensis TaxID=2788 RepID=A0ACC3BM85_PYRYE|nr:hypothetical protein I4F81_001475 [Neopyropia yezoensis]